MNSLALRSFFLTFAAAIQGWSADPCPCKPIQIKVEKGDTLQLISQRLYKTTRRWQEIHALNKGNLRNPNRLEKGQSLWVMPAIVSGYGSTLTTKNSKNFSSEIPTKDVVVHEIPIVDQESMLTPKIEVKARSHREPSSEKNFPSNSTSELKSFREIEVP